jgi:energy-coupling factor transporter ATP-binding protein EcfA2
MSNRKKTAILVIGDYSSGKSSIIRALTGIHGHNYIWRVRGLDGRNIKAFVIISSLQEDGDTKYFDPNKDNFISKLENRYKVEHDKYELLICPIEIRITRLYTFNTYANAFISNNYRVKLACIKKDWEGNKSDIRLVESFAHDNDLPLEILDIFKNDEHLESRKVRDNLYP